MSRYHLDLRKYAFYHYISLLYYIVIDKRKIMDYTIISYVFTNPYNNPDLDQ